MTTNPTPARYRHRTAEVEAVQWTGYNADEMAALCSPFDFLTIDPEDRVEDPDQTAAVRESAHGTWQGLAPGDWVVKRGKGIYGLSAAEFAERYEPAPAAAPVAVPPTGQTLLGAAEIETRPDLNVTPLTDDQLAADEEVERTGRPALLTEAERTMLTYALDQAQEHIWSRDGFTDEDQAAVTSLRRLAAEAQQQLETERPRCPHCQMPHDLTPGSMAVRACASISARIAETERRHAEGDHGGCARVDCEVVRARAQAEEDADPPAAVSAGVQPDMEAARIVAYRSDAGRQLNCLRHVPPPAARHADFHPVTSDDLPDGGVCTYPDCGVDVLAPQADLDPCPAKHGALGRICELPTGHAGMHTGSGESGAAVWDGDAP